MTATVFVDTNVLVYAQDLTEATKHPLAAAWRQWLWKTRRGRLSVQVLTEFYVTLTRKIHPPVVSLLAWSEVQDLFAWDPLPLDRAILERAWPLQSRFQLNWWDALIVAAAQQAGCRYLLTEDLQDGQSFDALTVLDPFRHQPTELTK